MTQYHSNNSTFFTEECQDEMYALKQAGKDDEIDTRGFVSILPWQKTLISDKIHVNLSLLQKLRKPLPESKKQQDEDEFKHLTSTLLSSNSNIESNSTIKIQKKSFYKEKITDQEHAQINERISLQQRHFANHELRERIRKYKTIREVFDYLSDEEINDVLKECENNEEKAICRLSEPGTLILLRKVIALRHSKEEKSYAPLIKLEQVQINKASSSQAVESTDVLRNPDETNMKRQPRTKLGLDAALKQFTDNLDAEPDKAFEGWSEARIRSYKMIDQNPNSYYYRFNEPGEEQKTGQWTEAEKRLFMDRLKEVGTEGQWGLFARGIPGRVGYQCSNYYRFLIETGQLQDSNYVIDPHGNAHYTFDKTLSDGTIEKRMRTHNKLTNKSPVSEENIPSSSFKSTTEVPKNENKLGAKRVKSAKRKLPKHKSKSKKSRRRHRLTMTKETGSDSEIESYDNDASGNFVPRNYYKTRADKVQRVINNRTRLLPGTIAKEKEGHDAKDPTLLQDIKATDEYECLLPGFIDPITLDQIEKPAISKYGHVMGYDSWLRCLSNFQGGLKRNVCPITKQALTKRDLVLLTSENFHIYKDKIANL